MDTDEEALQELANLHFALTAITRRRNALIRTIAARQLPLGIETMAAILETDPATVLTLAEPPHTPTAVLA